MKSTELRIGNYVNEIFYLRDPGGEHKYYKVAIVNDKDFSESRIKLFEPIALTEEWLVKLGFRKILGQRDYLFGSHPKLLRICYERSPRLAEFNYKEILIELSHVHQLQNLYFALTNQELTIK